MIKILYLAGPRPNFIKIAPLVAVFRAYSGVDQCLVHTGQYYDEKLSKVFFNDLEIPRPDVEFGVGSASPGVQTGRTSMSTIRS